MGELHTRILQNRHGVLGIGQVISFQCHLLIERRERGERRGGRGRGERGEGWQGGTIRRGEGEGEGNEKDTFCEVKPLHEGQAFFPLYQSQAPSSFFACYIYNY